MIAFVNKKKAIWIDFPDEARITRIVRDCYSKFGALKGSSSTASNNLGGQLPTPPTPYQFILPIMFGIYCHLQREMPLETSMAQGYVDDPDEITKGGRILNPVYEYACQAPLRAMAYFSWERERRVFLVRRVYPTYFDFLTYSHVPEGWGALGLTLKDIRKKRIQNGYSYPVYDIEQHQELIPYLSEAKRLVYSSVLVLPILRSFGPQVLLGAFAFYIDDNDSVQDPKVLRRRFRRFAEEMKTALVAHENAIQACGPAKTFSPLSQILLQIKNSPTSSRLVGSLRIVLKHQNIKKDGRALDEISDLLISQLSAGEFYPVQKKTRGRTRTIFVVPRVGLTAEMLEASVLSAAGHACKNRGFISYHFTDNRKRIDPR